MSFSHDQGTNTRLTSSCMEKEKCDGSEQWWWEIKRKLDFGCGDVASFGVRRKCLCVSGECVCVGPVVVLAANALATFVFLRKCYRVMVLCCDTEEISKHPKHTEMFCCDVDLGRRKMGFVFVIVVIFVFRVSAELCFIKENGLP